MPLEPVFVYPTHHYGSYADLRALIPFSGFDSVVVPLVDWKSERPHIFCAGVPGGDWPLAELPSRRFRAIYWNLERDPMWGHTWDEVWVSDRSFSKSGLRTRYVTLGSDPALAFPLLQSNLDELPQSIRIAYKYAVMAYMSHRRQRLLGGLIGKNLISPNAWGVTRRALLSLSKYMLCVHQDDQPIMEPLRYALAAAHQLPIVAEFCEDFYPWTVAGEFEEPDCSIKLYLLNHPNPMPSFRDSVMEALCER